MSKEKLHIIVFEHDSLRVNHDLSNEQLRALQQHYGSQGVPYYNLIHQGVKFNEYVGVIQVGKTLIEVLPKADKATHTKAEEVKWRDILIGMLKAVGQFDLKISSESNLKLKANTILDLYFEMFIKEVEYLLHTGLIKQYRKKEGNVGALKGNLVFGKHLQQNLTHQERFYVRHSYYDTQHQWHAILYQAIQLLQQINTRASLQSRIGALLLNFPEVPEIRVSEATFTRLVYSRKTEPYRRAIEIARLLLLRYHPDLSRGRNHVLALMFDMNLLWEQFVYRSLCKHKLEGMSVKDQHGRDFWQDFKTSSSSRIRPDILIEYQGKSIVLDTKWKNLNSNKPSSQDLQQMFVYHEYFDAERVALVYPGSKNEKWNGHFYHPQAGNLSNKECSLITLEVKSDVKCWQKNIYDFYYENMYSEKL